MRDDITPLEINARIAVAQAAASVAAAALGRGGGEETAAKISAAVFDALIGRVLGGSPKGIQ